MTTQELQEKHPDIFKKIGGIIYNLNKIETSIITALSIFFIDTTNYESVKTFIFNDALADEDIFPSLENKRRMLVKVIKGVWRASRENDIDFDKEKWLNICESIKKLQKIRNDLAHHHLVFLKDENVGYYLRKSNEELLEDRRQNKIGGMKMEKFNLDEEFLKSENVSNESEELTQFAVDALNILNRIAELRRQSENK